MRSTDELGTVAKRERQALEQALAQWLPTRRWFAGKGRPITELAIAEETELIVKRDARDATQTVQAGDAVLIDTTYLTQEDQVERIVALANAVTHRPSTTSGVDG